MAGGRESRGALLGALAALIPLLAVWGFTVDDALITARVAHHISLGHGSRFNLDGPSVDAVTPLGFAHLLSPFAGSTLSAFTAARVIGALAWIATGAIVGRAIDELSGNWERFLPLVALGFSLPLGAWAGSGMETGVVVLLATLATLRMPIAPLFAGLAGAWRPELLPWAMLVAIGTSLTRARRPGPALVALLLALGPAVLVAVSRQLLFGSPMPLAVLAKPSLLSDGIRYALGALLLSALPYLVIAPKGVRDLDGHDRTLLVAGYAHFVSIALAGGDWMVLFRLAVPVLPSFALVGAAIGRKSTGMAPLFRLAVALIASGIVWFSYLSSRQVWSGRRALIEAARPVFADAQRVATLDAGWVGAAFDGHVVDVAGVTDPDVARLPGGHTSKRLGPGFLERQQVDVVVVLYVERMGLYRVNDHWLLGEAEGLGFTRAGELPIPGTSYRYIVLKKPRH
jgi:hypothetical protein